MKKIFSIVFCIFLLSFAHGFENDENPNVDFQALNFLTVMQK